MKVTLREKNHPDGRVSWEVDFKHLGKRYRKRLPFRTKNRAERERFKILEELENDYNRFDVLPVDKKIYRFYDLCAEYLKHSHGKKAPHSPKSYRQDVGATRILMDHFCNVQLDAITVKDVEDFQIKRKEVVWS